MGFLKKLFSPIFIGHSDEIKGIYHQGVKALAKGDLSEAISCFVKVQDDHPSAAHNLGLIYLNGAGVLLPNFNKARKHFRLAHRWGHEKAEDSALFIGLEEAGKFDSEEKVEVAYAITGLQFGLSVRSGTDEQIGNLAYVMANDVIFLWSKRYRNQKKAIEAFLDYEVWCIRTFANKKARHFYQLSALKNYSYVHDDHEAVSDISDHLNERLLACIKTSKDFNINLAIDSFAVVRLVAVHCVYLYWKNGRF